jgi:hypothetical protein
MVMGVSPGVAQDAFGDGHDLPGPESGRIEYRDFQHAKLVAAVFDKVQFDDTKCSSDMSHSGI